MLCCRLANCSNSAARSCELYRFLPIAFLTVRSLIALGLAIWGWSGAYFAGNHEAAQRAAVVYSILATCKARQINPLAYLADVLDKLPARTVNHIDDLLPWNWKPDNTMEQLYKM